MKNIIFLLMLFGVSVQSYCQIKTLSVVCSDSVLMSIKGTYEPLNNIIAPGTGSLLSAVQQQEVIGKLDAVHQMLLSAYPVPTGFEASWWKFLNPGSFAAELDLQNGIPVCTYGYKVNFNSYACVQNGAKDLFCCEPGTSTFEVTVNNLEYFGHSALAKDQITINGLRVFMRNPVKGTWKGYELVHEGEVESTKRIVLLHRSGELPYIPVTRKQYLEFCINYLNSFFDEQINGMNLFPVRSLEEQEALKRKSLDKIDADYAKNPKQRDIIRKNFLDTYKTDQQKRDETVQKMVDNKKEVLKRYEDQMENTKASNLLDSPATIMEVATVHPDVPIFAPEEKNGQMLYTHNPVYIRKNLPKSVAQFIVVRWTWSDYLPVGGAAGMNFRKLLEENFPIEKLQSMIDK